MTHVLLIRDGYDRRKNPPLVPFRRMSLDEIKALRYGQEVWCIADNGVARRIRINGRVRTWKRNPLRIEVPCKYGLYEYFTLQTGEALERLLIRLED